MNSPEQSQLGKSSAYVDQYDAGLLFPIPRATKRAEIGVTGQPVFFGADLWTAFELSWLNPKGKPQVSLAHITVPAESTHIVESKSFKLYLNSFNNTRLDSADAVRDVIRRDISFSDALVLSKEAEEVLLWRDIQNDLVQQLLRRLAAAKPATIDKAH